MANGRMMEDIAIPCVVIRSGNNSVHPYVHVGNTKSFALKLRDLTIHSFVWREHDLRQDSTC